MFPAHTHREHGYRNPRPLRLALLAGAIMAGLACLPAHAADTCSEDNQNGCIELSPTPPQQTTAIPPNIVLILDDSGSMQWNYMPDSSYLHYTDDALINSSNNYVYYDPNVEYAPPPKADGSSYPSYSDITNVPSDGFNVGYGLGEDLTRHKGTQKHYSNSFNFYRKKSGRYYFVFAKGPVNNQTIYYVAPASTSNGCATGVYPCVTENDTSGAAAPKGIRAGTNIANWFAYYHNRILMAKSGLMSALTDLSPNYRFGFGAINDRNYEKLPDSTNTGIRIAQVKPFGDGSKGTQKKAFWDWLASMDPNGSTPLRHALEAAGKYYEESQPWKTMEGDPNYVKGGRNNDELACRASYTILTTDGFWNGGNPSPTIEDAANKEGPSHTNSKGNTVKYESKLPYSGGSASSGASLADIAAYYWKRDLKTNIDNLVPANSNDPAFWQHMTTFTMGIGFSPVQENGAEIPMNDIFAWARGGDPVDNFSWPTPSKDNVTNIADMAHAAVTGHGDFFSAKNPQELAEGFARTIAQITDRNVAPQASSVNASVAVSGALTFNTGYNTSSWTGSFQAVDLKEDGTTGEVKWDAGAQLDSRAWTSRKVFTATYTIGCDDPASASGTFSQGLSFSSGNSGALDCVQVAGLGDPAPDTTDDTINNRIDYLLGSDADKTIYRQREHHLGAIINSQPLYVPYPASGYYDTWPTGSPEAEAIKNNWDKSYSKYRVDHADREGTVYIGANDGMLHAFSAPAPKCTTTINGTNCDYGNGGKERWAFVPRAVYANLGNLTTKADFRYRPTVDATPISHDIFFRSKQWRTILVGGVGLGGRGVYALDITRQDKDNLTADELVLWEFDADMTADAGCYATYGECKSSDLGYTVSQPNVGRLANGRWVTVVPNGYFPDCTQPDTPTHEPEQGKKLACKAIASQAPKDEDDKPYSALFVLDAETGEMLAELKTPTDISGVTSFGLGSVVLGDYNNDQIDDVAYAGDLQGNLWRFDLSGTSPSDWKVDLAYKGKTDKDGKQGIQPITVMPRLFPDPFTNRFIVVFGTGKYLGAGDNTTTIPVQSVYGIRDMIDSSGKIVAATGDDLQSQTLSEDTITSGDLAGATRRALTANSLSASSLGWYFDLETKKGNTSTNAGERVVVTAGALFSTNTAVISTLIPGNDNYCDPSVTGAIMSVNATNGGPNGGLSILGGGSYVGTRVSNVRTGGSLPMVGSMGGGAVYLPGTSILGAEDNDPPKSMQLDSPIWRRRSWSNLEIQP